MTEGNKKEVTMDDLAAMVQNGFLNMEKRLDTVESDIKDIKSDTESIKADLNKKVDKIEYNTLDYRVERLEKKLA